VDHLVRVIGQVSGSSTIDRKRYTHVNLPSEDGQHEAVIPERSKGQSNASATIATLMHRYPSIEVLIFLGIAGGMPGRVKRGDVLVSNQVFDSDPRRFDPNHVWDRPSCPIPDPFLVKAAEYFETPGNTVRAEWRDIWHSLISSAVVKHEFPDWENLIQSLGVDPRPHCGTIASGDAVMNSKKDRDEWANKISFSCFGDTEGAAVANQSHQYHRQYLVIRGISDFGEGDMNDDHSSFYGPFSAHVAAACLGAVLKRVPSHVWAADPWANLSEEKTPANLSEARTSDTDDDSTVSAFGPTEELLTIRADRRLRDSMKMENFTKEFADRHVDQSTLYWEINSYTRWLALCAHPKYELHRIAFKLVQDKIKDIVSLIQADSKAASFDFINIGPGGAQKDITILSALVAASQVSQKTKIRYVALDQSYSMLIGSLNTVIEYQGRNPEVEIEVLGILGDLRRLSDYKHIIDIQKRPRVYGLLGSLLGNFDERLILSSIRNAMRNQDYLLLGAELIAGRAEPELTKGYNTKPVRDLILEPIREHLPINGNRKLLAQLKKARVEAEVTPGSRVPSAMRVQMFFSLNGARYTHFFSTKYDLSNLRSYIRETGFVIVGKEIGDTFEGEFTSSDAQTKEARYVKFVLKRNPDWIDSV